MVTVLKVVEKLRLLPRALARGKQNNKPYWALAQIPRIHGLKPEAFFFVM